MFDLDFLYDHELCAVCILEGQFFFSHWKEKILQMIGAAERSGYRSKQPDLSWGSLQVGSLV